MLGLLFLIPLTDLYLLLILFSKPFTGVWNQYVQIFEGGKINITGLLNKLAFINRDWFNLSIRMATLCFDHWCIPHRRCHIDCMAVFGDHLLRFLNKSWKLPTLFSSVYTIHKGLIYFISCHFSDFLLLGHRMLSI